MLRIPSWPRVLLVAGLALATLVFIPLVLTLLAYLVGFDACDDRVAASDRWICSSTGRWVSLLVIIALGLRPAMWWGSYLQRMLFTTTQRGDSIGSMREGSNPASDQTPISLGQNIVSGRIHFSQGGSRTAEVSGQVVAFLSDWSLNQGLVKSGDQIRLVYQRLPGKSTPRLALAFSTASTPQPKGVADGAFSATAVVAALSLTWFAWLAPVRSLAWTIVCSLILVLNVAYLILVLRAKRTLEGFSTQPE